MVLTMVIIINIYKEDYFLLSATFERLQLIITVDIESVAALER